MTVVTTGASGLRTITTRNPLASTARVILSSAAAPAHRPPSANEPATIPSIARFFMPHFGGLSSTGQDVGTIVGRQKDKARIEQLLQQAGLDETKLANILQRHKLK